MSTRKKTLPLIKRPYSYSYFHRRHCILQKAEMKMKYILNLAVAKGKESYETVHEVNPLCSTEVVVNLQTTRLEGWTNST